MARHDTAQTRDWQLTINHDEEATLCTREGGNYTHPGRATHPATCFITFPPERLALALYVISRVEQDLKTSISFELYGGDLGVQEEGGTWKLRGKFIAMSTAWPG